MAPGIAGCVDPCWLGTSEPINKAETLPEGEQWEWLSSNNIVFSGFRIMVLFVRNGFNKLRLTYTFLNAFTSLSCGKKQYNNQGVKVGTLGKRSKKLDVL